MNLALLPITRRDARRFVVKHHRHGARRMPATWLFQVAVADSADNQNVVGVAIVGTPEGRGLMDGRTVEVLRVCTLGTPQACSMLYGACRRAALALGYLRVVTYTRCDEPGTSLRASGFKAVESTRKRSWEERGRPRRDLFGDREEDAVPRVRWEWCA